MEKIENPEDKVGKYQPYYLKYSIYYSKHSICDSKHSFLAIRLLKHFTAFMLTVEKSQHTHLENMILGHIKMGELQAKYGALAEGEKQI